MQRGEKLLMSVFIAIGVSVLPVDNLIVQTIFLHRHPMLNIFFIYYTIFGNYIFALIEGILLFAFKNDKFRRHLYLVLNSYAGWFIADRIVVAIKNLTRRLRPFISDPTITPLVSAGGFSFPSRHSCAAWALITPFLISTDSWSIRVLLILFAVLMSFSRVYCGVHYTSDIIIGACIGYAVSKLIFDNLTSKKICYKENP